MNNTATNSKTHDEQNTHPQPMDDTSVNSYREQKEHTYFLDRETAYTVALQKNNVPNDTQEEMQYCYYDGEPFDNAPEQLINVKIEYFTNFFVENEFPLPTFLCNNDKSLTPEMAEQVQQSYDSVVQEVVELRNTIGKKDNTPAKYQHADTYFFDAKQALETAQQNNRVDCGHPTIDGLQLCYYNGEHNDDQIDDAPKNLIAVKFENILQHLLTTRYRIPSSIAFPVPSSEEQNKEIVKLYQQVVDEVNAQRTHTANDFADKIRQQNPVIVANEPLRVFFPTTRLTTVMQYASKNLAKAFEKLGHETMVSVEKNDMERVDMSHRLADFYDFEPHVVVHVNSRHNSFLNPSIYNVTWWQDAMPEIKQQESLEWRERDFIYSAVPQLDGYLEKCGAKGIARQSFCIDTDNFRIVDNVTREDKIIFIGSSYIRHLLQHDNHQQALNSLLQYFESGAAITEELLQNIASENTMTYDYVFWHLFHYVVRDYSVKWLCEHSPIPVEVYGPDWEFDEIVKPHYKGKLQHGTDVINAYNSARYALVSHPFELNSQRLAEAAACGCIPLVYDCRHSSDLPHWEDDLLFYRTKGDLMDLISNNSGSPSTRIAEHYSYSNFAQKIIDRIRNN